MLSQSSALNLDWQFLLELRDAGRAAADQWLSGTADESDSLAAAVEKSQLSDDSILNTRTSSST
jgi:hypothetical protein